jgi:hypothetical protein
MDIHETRTEASQQEKITKMDAWIEGTEANRENSDAVATHPEVPNEEAEVEDVGALEDRYGDGI